MKIVIPGGSGQVGHLLARAFAARGDEVVIVARGSAPAPSGTRLVAWDGKSLGPWAQEVDGAEAVINLAGRSVNCRYSATHLAEMMDSRVESTRVVGEAIAQAARPPRVWLQMSTATIYAHRFDGPNDEATGRIGGGERGAPAYWDMSVQIARAWERTLAQAATPNTRRVALRTALVLSPDRGGIFDVLLGLTRRGLGGTIGGGRQMVSWIQDIDFVRAVALLLDTDSFEGPVNLASPNPLPQREFMAALRAAARVSVGLPATKWMAVLGAAVMRTDAELVLKSRFVIPGRLTQAGFTFLFPDWPLAVRDLASRWPEGPPPVAPPSSRPVSVPVEVAAVEVPVEGPPAPAVDQGNP